ncbi:MAG: hypothetical protein ACERKN_19390 [Velocimicrobium sp.]
MFNNNEVNIGNYACIMLNGIYHSENEMILLSEVNVTIYDKNHHKIYEYKKVLDIPSNYNDRHRKNIITSLTVQKDILNEINKLLETYSVIEVYTWNTDKLEKYINFLSDINEDQLAYLMFIKSLKDILEDNLIGCGVAQCNMYFGMYKWMEVYNIEKIDECGNVNKVIYQLSHLVRAYLTNQHIDMNRYNSIINAHISEENEYLNKIDLGFYELEFYMNRRLLQKAINIAGSTGNIKDFRKNLIQGKFNDEQCYLLQQYYAVMRHKYLKSIGHKDDEKIMQYANYYPLSIVEKVIPKQILEKAKKIAKDSFDEAIYKKRLKKVFNDDMHQRILMQCYNSFRVEDNKKILISRQNNKVNRNHDFKSNNAIIAENNGLFTLQHLDDDRLKKYGFNYRLDFFRWLCSNNYIAPKEIHHVGPKARSTGYYDNSTITYVVEHYDLEFLYRIFSKEIDYMQALDEKNISFCYVEANRELVGLRSGDPVKVYCVRQKNKFWFSKQKYIKLNGNNIRILSECKYPDKEFSNVNYQKVIKMLLSRKKIKLIRDLI